MRKLVVDIETDGLNATKLWCLVAQDTDTEELYSFSDDDPSLPSILEGIKLCESADVLIAHNGIGFDFSTIDRLYGTKLLEKNIHDTWVMSQTLQYKRGHKHNLEEWGLRLGNEKIDFHDYSKYSKELLKYCQQDVKLNLDIYRKLMKDFSNIYKSNPLIQKGLQVEMEIAKMNYQIKTEGWNFDIDSAIQTQAMFTERMFQIESILEPKLGTHIVYIDKKPKTAKFKKDGTYTAVTCKILSEYFGHEVLPEDTHLMPAGKEFRRHSIKQIDLGQIALVKGWLLENGWEPDEYTTKKINGKWVNQGPKLTERSLRKFGEDGELISEYYTLRNRLSVIEGWLEKIKDGRLHGNMWTIGTPSFRARHEVIVNLPSVDSTYGKPLREVFRADEGEVVVGCDSAGNQLRGLCHFVGNPEFTQEVIYGDQHQRNADALGCSRSVAKTYLYAYLFGAGDAKLGKTLGASGPKAKRVGAKSREDFAKNIKGLQELSDRIKGEWNTNSIRQGVGWFKGLDGRPVFCDSDHQCLNYLLQSTEAITCKAACVYAIQKIREEGLRAKPRIWYHDEMAFTCHPDDAQRVGEILKEAYTEAPKWFGVECMDGGDPQFGDTYAAVH